MGGRTMGRGRAGAAWAERGGDAESSVRGAWRHRLVVLCGIALSALLPLAPGEGEAPGAVDPAGRHPGLPREADRESEPAGGSRRAELSRGVYDDLIALVAAEEGVDADLVHAIIRLESRYDPLALSHRGAKGLMQLTAPTVSRYAVSDPFDPAANLRGGIRHLRFLQELFPGRLSWALAAYNAGEHAVLRYQGIPPFRETQAYVTRILAHYAERTLETGRAILPFGHAAEAAAR